MKSYEMHFTGRILERGFWLYVWRISSANKTFWYVGRTGDSSSKYAASPFSRLSRHLDLRSSAKANTLARNLRAEDIAPETCEYKLLTLGPLFPEQNDFAAHKPYRDIVGKLEAELAYHLTERGLLLLGNHPKRGDFDKPLFATILKKVDVFIKSG